MTIYFTDTTAALQAFRADQLDVVEVTSSDMITVTANPRLANNLISAPGTYTFWWAMDNQTVPFSGTAGLKLRQAIGHAIDRSALISATLNNSGAPAVGLLPPSTYGYNPAVQGLPFNPISATQRLTESGYLGTPQIVFLVSATHLPRAQNIHDQLLSNLGINITVVTTTIVSERQLRGWCADYADPSNWLPVLLRTPIGRTGDTRSFSRFGPSSA